MASCRCWTACYANSTPATTAALIFTQFTRMLDVLEHFLSIYSYPYLRLDGSTKPEERQRLMEKFNHNPKYFIMLLSTRSGGVGVNLTGADTVIFYDHGLEPGHGPAGAGPLPPHRAGARGECVPACDAWHDRREHCA